jgi:hypothetical protein
MVRPEDVRRVRRHEPVVASPRDRRASRVVGGGASRTISDTGRRSRNERSLPVISEAIVETYWMEDQR